MQFCLNNAHQGLVKRLIKEITRDDTELHETPQLDAILNQYKSLEPISPKPTLASPSVFQMALPKRLSTAVLYTFVLSPPIQ
jgi:hypothetical protein